jgi:hypothetical protein
MARASQSWLDGLARRSVRSRHPMTARRATGRQSPSRTVVRAPEMGAERYSRAKAFKLAIVGAASLSFGLGRVTPSHAQSRGDCIVQCYTKYTNRAERDIAACNHLHRNERWKGTDPGGWARFKAALEAGGWSWVKQMLVDAQRDLCITKAANVHKLGLDKCDDACDETCPKSLTRSPQGLNGTRQVCHAPDPPKSTPPTPPPAPNPTSDPCAPCEAQGGVCCGPAPPGGVPCNCASYDPDGPVTPCQRVNCG